MSDGFDEIVNTASPKVQNLARRTKTLIIKIMPEVVEVAWPVQRNIGYGVGPKKMSEQFCYIGVLKDHVNLGFYYGTELPDPANLLEGTGQQLRHIKITAPEQLDDPAVLKLVEAASKHLPRLKS
jgi:hypothetical protein